MIVALEGSGRLHAMVGAHHGPFLHRWSDDPADPASWSEAVPLGPAHTYPALAVDEEGNLHLAYREKGERWELQYRRQKAGQRWEDPISIAVSPTPGYNHFMQALNVGPTGTLHLTFQFFYAENEESGLLGKAAVHVKSTDGGNTWSNEGEPCVFPLTIHTARPYVSCFDDQEASLRAGPQVVDDNDNPWIWSVPKGNLFGGHPGGSASRL